MGMQEELLRRLDELKVLREGLENAKKEGDKEHEKIYAEALAKLQPPAPEDTDEVDWEGCISLPINPSQEIYENDGQPILQYGLWVPVKRGDANISRLLFVSEKGAAFGDSPALPELRVRWPAKKIKEWIDSGKKSDPQEVLRRVREKILSHVEFKDPREATLAALWTIGTYFFIAFPTYPYLSLYGEKNVGKSRLGQVVTNLAFNGETLYSVKETTLYRGVAIDRPTVFLDELNYLSKEQKDMIMTLLRVGYKKGGAVGRAVKVTTGKKERFTLEKLEVYSPKLFASTWELYDIADRAIEIHLFRTTNPAITKNEPSDLDREWEEIRSLLYPFALEQWHAIREKYLALQPDDFFYSRRFERWRALRAIADHLGVGEELFALAKEKEALTEVESATKEDLMREAILRYKAAFPETKLLVLKEFVAWLSSQEGLLEDQIDFDNEKGNRATRIVSDTLRRIGVKLLRSNGRRQVELTDAALAWLLRKEKENAVSESAGSVSSIVVSMKKKEESIIQAVSTSDSRPRHSSSALPALLDTGTSSSPVSPASNARFSPSVEVNSEKMVKILSFLGQSETITQKELVDYLTINELMFDEFPRWWTNLVSSGDVWVVRPGVFKLVRRPAPEKFGTPYNSKLPEKTGAVGDFEDDGESGGGDESE